MKTRFFLNVALILSSAVLSAEQGKVPVPYGEVKPIVRAMDEILPSELKGKSPAEQEAVWPRWLSGLNSRIRERLVQGDEDTLVNFVFFGSSYTRQPRLALADIKPISDPSKADPKSPLSLFPSRIRQILEARIQDFMKAVANPKDDERLAFFRSLLQQKGFAPGMADPARIKMYIELNLMRFLKEAVEYASVLEAAQKQGNAASEFVRRSTLFVGRGLSLDTSLAPAFALEESLNELQLRRLIDRGNIRRAAVIGPGLDLIDKDEGADTYPPQTVQPFSLVESLFRLGLAREETLEVTTMDVSPRISEHLNRARRSAAQGKPYSLQLTRSSRIDWSPEYRLFWERFGALIGPAARPAQPLPRTVNIRPDVVLRIHPENLNIVTERKVLPADGRFDLIVATNILVYYDVFQQSLALANIQSMLRPGGILLSNNALLELPSSQIRSIGYKTVVYSNRASDGDTIVWYQKQARPSAAK